MHFLCKSASLASTVENVTIDFRGRAIKIAGERSSFSTWSTNSY